MCAKDAWGSLTGKLTDSYSTPLEGATVTVRNLATGRQARAVVGKNGVYKFTGLEPGSYTLEADSPQLGRGMAGRHSGHRRARGAGAGGDASWTFRRSPLSPSGRA